MPSLLPIGGAIRLNASAGGAATVVPLAEGGFAAVYKVAAGPDVFTLYDDNFNAITGETPITSDDFMAPQAAALNDGQFVVTWLDNEQNIEASIYNNDGSLAVGPVTIATPTDASVGLGEPRVVGNAFGGFTAIWQDNATIDGVTGPVFIQSYDGNGNPVGDPITVAPPTVGAADQSSIDAYQIAVLGDGTTVVAAQVEIDGVDSIMYSVNGGPLISLAGGDPNYLYTNPQITPLAAGGYVITYDFVDPGLVGSDSPDANWTTGGAVFTSAGNLHYFAIGTTVTTTANGTFAVDPSVITPLADGGFVVTFEPLTSPLGDGYLVDAQQFDAFGNAVGPVVLVAPEGFQPSVATSADGVVLDTYQLGSGVFLQPFSSAPTPWGPEPAGTSFGLDSVVSANSPGVAPLSDGGFVVVYQDQNQNSWAQIYDYYRRPVGSAFQIAVNGTQPVVASQSNGTFLVAWSTGSEIMGALYDDQGNQLSGPFDMSGAASSLPLLDPALNALPNGGYSLAYETDLRDGTGSHVVTIQEFDGDGNPVGASVSQTYAPTNPLAPPRIAALEAELFGSVTVMGVGDEIVAAIVSAPPTGNSSAGIAGQSIQATTQSGTQPILTTVQVSGANDGATRDGAQVATLNDGNIAVVWSEAGATANTWSIVGQVMTPAGTFVGSQFSIGTALPSNSPASQIALSALPGGGFLVTYDSGNTSLAAQRFDQNGNAIGAPVLMTGSGQADVVTTVLNDGTLVLLSDNTPQGGGTVTGQAFTLPGLPMNWTGSDSTVLATAGNWDVNAAPDIGHVMQFGLANGGTLTGTATAAAAAFSGQGSWVLSDATVNLTQGMTEQSTLQIDGGAITTDGGPGGTAAVGAAGGASVTVSGGAQDAFQNTAVGTNAGQSGTLTLSGSGTTWTDTGTGGNGGFQAGASSGSQPGDGVIDVTEGALLTGLDSDVLGGTAGSEGDLSITNAGSVSDSGLDLGAAGTGVASVDGGSLSSSGTVEVGQAAGGQGTLTVTGSAAAVTVSGPMIVGGGGSGSLTIQNQATVQIGGTTSATASGIDVGAASGGLGTVAVSGASSLLSNAGSFVVGDSGLGSLAIDAGGTVITSAGSVAGLAGAVIANTASAGGSSVDVSGAGSNWRITGSLVVGNGGDGALSVSRGATVDTTGLDEAAAAGGSGEIGVTGAGSMVDINGTATVGDQSAATLSILNGGSFQAQYLNAGMGGATGAITVGGSATDFHVTNDMTVGANGIFSIGAGVTVFIDGNFAEIGAVNQGDNSLIDPSTITNSSPHGSGGGAGVAASVSITNNSTYIAGGANNGAYILTTPLLNGTGVLEIDPAINVGPVGDLVLNTGSVTSAQSVVFGGTSGILTLGTETGTGTPAITGFQAVIDAFVAGDTIMVDTTAAVDFTLNGSVISVVNTVGGAPEGTLAFANASMAGVAAETSGALEQQVACFAAGTGIATTRGIVPVESIHPGDRVCTVFGGDTAEVIWVGRRKVDCARHPNPVKVWPVRVLAHAFGRGMPATDLVLSPDHAVYVDEVLIPIRLLVNGRTVRQELADRISYYHIELTQHDVLLANGMPAESYLDTGDRARFSNGGGVIALHPDFSARTWEMRGCAPLVQAGPVLSGVRKRLAADVARRKRQTRETQASETTWPRR